MTATHDIISQYFRGPGAAIWTESVQAELHSIVANEVRRQLDVATGMLANSVLDLDRADKRLAFFAMTPQCTDRIVNLLLLHKKVINLHITSIGGSAQSGIKLKACLELIVPALLTESNTLSIINESPFPRAWAKVADLLVKELHMQWLTIMKQEWLIHNYAVVSAFFLTCQLPTTYLVRSELNNRIGNNANGVRGSLLRLVERIGPDGILDVSPPASTRQGPLSIRNARLSTLLSTIQNQANLIPKFKGALQSTINNKARPIIPLHAPPAITEKLILKARHAMFQQYDFTILGHMTLAAIEQILRTWAEHVNLPHIENGIPLSLKSWLPSLGCSISLLSKLNELYDAKSSNIRNRINHGALLEAENLRMDTAFQLLQKPTASVDTTWNRYSPENIAKLCLECLELIDREAPKLSKPDAFKWITYISPSSNDLASVADPNTDLLHPLYMESWRCNLRSYVLGVCPAASIYFQVGYQGWADRTFNPVQNLSKMYALVLVFEAVARNTFHIMNSNILQVSPEGAGMKVYYRMLEYRGKGLCSQDNITKLLNAFPDNQHVAIQHYLQMSIRIRDAFAHGALLQFDDTARGAIGHCLLKTIQAFRHAGRTHMINENAYYRWLQRRSNEDRSLEDWNLAQIEVDAFFNSISNKEPS